MKFKNFKYYILLLILLFIFCIPIIDFINVSAMNQFSDVLDDLSIDESFNASKYFTMSYEETLVNKQKLLEIINIAESEKGDLYLYVYEPTYSTLDVNACKISMSTEFCIDGEVKKPKLYDLSLVSTNGVFNKYKVLDFDVLNVDCRYYNIVSIYRDLIIGIDDNIIGGTKNYIAVEVGQQWACYTKDGLYNIEMNTFKTVEVTPIMNGTFRFFNGFNFGSLFGRNEYTDLHFISFNVENFDVKKIYDADITYKTRECQTLDDDIYDDNKFGIIGDYTNKSNWSNPIYKTLTQDDEFTVNSTGILSQNASWKRILSAEKLLEYSSDAKLIDGTISKLQNSQWVFSFLDTPFTTVRGASGHLVTFTEVSEVTLLRLHFLDVHDDVYNLGVVMDITTPDDDIDNEFGPDLSGIEDALSIILYLLLIVILVSLINPILSICKILWSLLKVVFDVIVSIILFPINMIKKLFK